MSKVFTLDFITFLFISQLCYSACVQLRVDNFQDPPARSATQPFNSLLIHVILVIYVQMSFLLVTKLDSLDVKAAKKRENRKCFLRPFYATQ